MVIAGALVVPDSRHVDGRDLCERLQGVAGLEIKEIGPRGIAVVLEGADSAALKKISESIRTWEGVADFQLAYLNWEDIGA